MAEQCDLLFSVVSETSKGLNLFLIVGVGEVDEEPVGKLISIIDISDNIEVIGTVLIEVEGGEMKVSRSGP